MACTTSTTGGYGIGHRGSRFVEKTLIYGYFRGSARARDSGARSPSIYPADCATQKLHGIRRRTRRAGNPVPTAGCPCRAPSRPGQPVTPTTVDADAVERLETFEKRTRTHKAASAASVEAIVLSWRARFSESAALRGDTRFLNPRYSGAEVPIVGPLGLPGKDGGTRGSSPGRRRSDAS